MAHFPLCLLLRETSHHPHQIHASGIKNLNIFTVTIRYCDKSLVVTVLTYNYWSKSSVEHWDTIVTNHLLWQFPNSVTISNYHCNGNLTNRHTWTTAGRAPSAGASGTWCSTSPAASSASPRDELYTNRSSRKIDSQSEKRSSGSPILLKIVSENRLSEDTYFYTIASRCLSSPTTMTTGAQSLGTPPNYGSVSSPFCLMSFSCFSIMSSTGKRQRKKSCKQSYFGKQIYQQTLYTVWVVRLLKGFGWIFNERSTGHRSNLQLPCCPRRKWPARGTESKHFTKPF